MGIVEQAFRQAFAPPDRRTPWEWSEDNLLVDPTSPFQGKWRSELSPWVREVMEVFADNRLEQLVVMCSAQSAKTQTMICLMAWALSQEPAPAMWVTSTGEEASFFMKTRVVPTIQGCEALSSKLVAGASAMNKQEVTFEGASLILTGSSSPSRLQSKPVRWLFLDEVRNYPEGALEMVQKRTRAYWNSRTVLVSTPCTENDAMHRAFLEGDQRLWHYQCPTCDDFVPLRWGDLRWGDNCKNPDGSYDFEKVNDTIRLVCPRCSNEMEDNPTNRRHIAEEGKFVPMNPNASKGKVSFQWNALLPTWVKWKDLVSEFLMATTAIKNGDPSPLKDFINESAGEPWQETMRSVDDDTIDSRRADYKLGESWEDEYCRFMAVDVQGGGGLHYWYAIRAFAKEGANSRLIAYGKAYSETELLEIAKANKVANKLCLIDCGWNTAGVLRFCQRHGWKPFRGDGAKHFSVRDKKTGKVVKQIWTETYADASMGTRQQGKSKRVLRYVWSNDSAKDILAELMSGAIGQWSIAKNTAQDYIKQVTAEIREEKTSGRGEIKYQWRQIRRDNHLRDCELMILVASIATRQLGYDREPIDKQN